MTVLSAHGNWVELATQPVRVSLSQYGKSWCSAQITIKGDRVAAARLAADFSDHIVGKARLAGTETDQTLAHHRLLLEAQEVQTEELLQYGDDLSLGLTVNAVQNPYQFA